MPSAQHQVTIRRPLYEVFAFVADTENDPRWRPGVAEIERISGEGAGAKYRQLIKGPGGRTIPADFEIVEFEDGFVYREESKDMAGRIRAGKLFEADQGVQGSPEVSQPTST